MVRRFTREMISYFLRKQILSRTYSPRESYYTVLKRTFPLMRSLRGKSVACFFLVRSDRKLVISFPQIEEIMPNVVWIGALGPILAIYSPILFWIWFILYGVSSYLKIFCMIMRRGRNCCVWYLGIFILVTNSIPFDRFRTS